MKHESEKRCSSCECLLPITEFYRRGEGFGSRCKVCQNDACEERRARIADQKPPAPKQRFDRSIYPRWLAP